MLIKNSIIAGEILILLEKARRAVSLEELQYHLEEPYHHIQAGVERLIHEGLAVLDIDSGMVKVERFPFFEDQKDYKRKIKANKVIFA